MARKTLPYNTAIESQETYYNCGPATVQNITSSRKVISEADLAREMGTSTRGTDYIGYLANSLRRHLGVDYPVVNIPGNDATEAQREAFWGHLKRSIDGGFGVAMNWIAPPTNYPRGVNGSRSPSYGGGTVYHYVAAMGYEERGNERFVFVVDSGFNPKSYWVTLRQCASLIAGKGYAYANVAPVPAKPVDDFQKTVVEPIAKRVSEVREQLTGLGEGYQGWPQLGGRTLTDAIAEILKVVGR